MHAMDSMELKGSIDSMDPINFMDPTRLCAPGSLKSLPARSTHDPKIQATRNTSYLTASKSLNGRKIARMARTLTIFGQMNRLVDFLKKFRTGETNENISKNRSRRCNDFDPKKRQNWSHPRDFSAV